MGAKTGIRWTDRTQNFWRGCTKVSPGCANCYMFTEQRRYGQDPETVVRTKTWGHPRRWNEEALQAGRRFLVFTNSWSDFLHRAADPWRDEAWKVIRETPNLIYQILTKRPERLAAALPEDWGDGGYENVWLGVSVENNDYTWRADLLRELPARIRFISAEPLLGPLPDLDLENFHWVIVGGESGTGHRPMDHAWASELLGKSRQAGAAFFFKQSAAFLPGQNPVLGGVRYEEFPDTVEYRHSLTQRVSLLA